MRVYYNVSKEDEMTDLERDTIQGAGAGSRVDARERTVLRRDRRGFSMVELITVMGIVGALATMAIPTYNSYLKTVKNGRCVADLRTIDKAVTAYVLDNNGPPPGNDLSVIGTTANQLDPWGRQYVYQNLASPGATPLLDQFGEPLNTDYDLYSLGSDGVSVPAYTDNCDDIARYNNGLFVGLRD